MLTDIFLDNALTIARQAAESAAAVIARHYRTALCVETKADQTPVTAADREAEAVIKQVLRRGFPDHAFYGEEEGREGEGDFLWLIDPIDGTRSFVRGYPMFSTQIALMHRNELVLGVSNAALRSKRKPTRRRSRSPIAKRKRRSRMSCAAHFRITRSTARNTAARATANICG